jgi:hypothetical protein
VTIDGVWIGNRIYWTLKHNLWLLFTKHSHTQTLVFSVTAFTALVGSGFQSGRSPNPDSLPRRLVTISHQPPTLLIVVLGLLMTVGRRYISAVRTSQKTLFPAVFLLLHYVAIGTARVEDTASHSYSTVAKWSLLSHCLAPAMKLLVMNFIPVSWVFCSLLDTNIFTSACSVMIIINYLKLEGNK